MTNQAFRYANLAGAGLVRVSVNFERSPFNKPIPRVLLQPFPRSVLALSIYSSDIAEASEIDPQARGLLVQQMKGQIDQRSTPERAGEKMRRISHRSHSTPKSSKLP